MKKNPENPALTMARKKVKPHSNYEVQERLDRLKIDVTKSAVAKIGRGTKSMRMDVLAGLLRIVGNGKFSAKAWVEAGRKIDKIYLSRR